MAKKWRHQLSRWITKTIELPPDVMMDLPRITMIGQLHIYIENHEVFSLLQKMNYVFY